MILSALFEGKSVEEAKKVALTHLKLTHDSPMLWEFADVSAALST